MSLEWKQCVGWEGIGKVVCSNSKKIVLPLSINCDGKLKAVSSPITSEKLPEEMTEEGAGWLITSITGFL